MHGSLRSKNDTSPRVIFIEELSELIGKAPTTIRTCATNAKYLHLIPRPFKMPNSGGCAGGKATFLRGSTQVGNHRPLQPDAHAGGRRRRGKWHASAKRSNRGRQLRGRDADHLHSERRSERRRGCGAFCIHVQLPRLYQSFHADPRQSNAGRRPWRSNSPCLAAQPVAIGNGKQWSPRIDW